MRDRPVHGGRFWLVGLSVQALLLAGTIFLGAAGISRGESYYGLPVAKTVSGYKLVDIRPVLSKLRPVNYRARDAFSVVGAATPLCNVSIGGWKPLALNAIQINYTGGRNVPAGSQFFYFLPQVRSSMYVVGGLYYANGAWYGAHIGASRESEFGHLWDLRDGNYSSPGWWFEGWCLPWSKTYPTVVVMMDYYGTVLTYGVVINPLATETYPAAPASKYELVQKNATWTEAKADAAARGGHLATITSPAEWNNILKQLGDTLTGKSVWLGASDAQTEGSWQWVTGEKWGYSRWATGQPNNVGKAQHYLQLMNTTGAACLWDDQSLVRMPYYLLERPAAAPATQVPDHTYILIQKNATWTEAKADAEARGGYLATITSAGEWSNIEKQLGNSLLNKGIWLGGSDAQTEGNWKWLTGEAWSYARWGAGQPNNIDGVQDYLQLWSVSGTAYQWDDQHNVPMAYYLLERSGRPAISLGAASAGFPAAGGQQSLAVSANVPWSAQSQAAWISIKSGAAGMDNGTVVYQAAVNDGAARSGKITIAGHGQACTLAVQQAAAQLQVGPAQTLVPRTGANALDLTVSANVPWTAAASGSWITFPAGAAGTGDGTLRCRVAANTGGLRTGTITVSVGALQRTVQIYQWPQRTGTGRAVEGDFDGDGKADLALFRRAAGIWDLVFSRGGQWALPWGWHAVVAAPADYDGDGVVDVAVYHPAGGTWCIFQSTGGSRTESFGWSATIPLPGDYDGDGRADLAVFHQAAARWYFRYSRGGPDASVGFGWSAVIPVPADYDGDGVLDLAVYHPAGGRWYYCESASGDVVEAAWSRAAAVPVPADYDGDGAADLAVFDRKTATWHIRYSGGGDRTAAFGWAAVLPIPADYDGDGKADLAVYHPAGGNAYIETRPGEARAVPANSLNATPVLSSPRIHSWFRLP